MPTSKPPYTKNKSVMIPASSAIRGFQYLSLQGGGMKGIGHIGAIEELEKNTVLAQIEAVAGSSAGGLMATLLAIGCQAKEIRELMLNVDFISLQDKSEIGWIESTRLQKVMKGGLDLTGDMVHKVNAIKSIPILGILANEVLKPYVNKVNRVISYGKTITNVLSHAKTGEELIQLALGSELGLWEGEALTYWLAEIIARKTGNPNITFKELAALTQIANSPFKKLVLTGSNITDQKLEYYSAETTPDMPILQAARISASFPGGYKPIITIEEQEDGNKRSVVRVDGGLLENLPDVFNKKPYLLPGENQNPRVLALSFKTADEEIPKKIQNSFDLIQALYNSKMSEKALYEKYGSHIVFTDTLEVGTLEFSLPLERKEKLAQSGSIAVQEAFKKIIDEEIQQTRKGTFYNEITNEELLRIIVELEHTSAPEHNEEYDNFLLELENRELSLTELEELKQAAEKNYLRKQKLTNDSLLTSEELSKICKRKREELFNTEAILEQKIRNFELAKLVLEDNHQKVLARFLENNGKNEFRSDLEKLYSLAQRAKDNRMERGVGRQNKKLEESYQAIKKESAHLYQEIEQKYQNDSFMVGFFQNLQEAARKPGFTIPTNRQQLHHYCLEDIQQYETHLKQAKKELSKSKQELQLFNYQAAHFSNRETKSTQFSRLLHLKIELDKSIARTTTLITKMNAFFLKKAPRLKRVITPVFKAASFLAFVCTLPVAVPVVPIFKMVEKFSHHKNTQEIAREIIDYFKWSDIHKDLQLKALQEVTAQCIKVMQKNYIAAEDKELTALHQLHALFLEKSGIKLEEIFIKKAEESSKDYQERLINLKKQYTPNGNEKIGYSTLEALAEELATKKDSANLSTKTGYHPDNFIAFCKELTKRLSNQHSTLQSSEHSLQLFTNTTALQVDFLENSKTINTTLPNDLHALKKIFPLVITSWKEVGLGNPVLSGPLENLHYMTKELLAYELSPEFTSEATALLKEVGYGNAEQFIAKVQAERPTSKDTHLRKPSA